MARAIPRDCPECGGADLRFRVVESGGMGWYDLRLLPGLGGILTNAPVTVVLCRECGLVRLFAQPKALEKLDHVEGWQSVAAVEAESARGPSGDGRAG